MPAQKFSQQVILVVDNVRSVLNVGSFFRTADGAGVDKIILCGYTPTPDKNDMSKTALGAELVLPWEYSAHTWRAIEDLKKQNFKIYALEQSSDSKNYAEFKFEFPCALIVGNEVDGISEKILKRCDVVIELPMHGSKESLNVGVACGIGLYKINEKRK